MSTKKKIENPEQSFPAVLRVGDVDEEGNIYSIELLAKIAEDAPEEYSYDPGVGVLISLFETVEDYEEYVSKLEFSEEIDAMDLTKITSEDLRNTNYKDKL